MFKLIFEGIYPDAVFWKNGVEQSMEDHYTVKDTIFCVADGVTRDPINGKLVPYPKTKEEVEYLASVYPNPSGALLSAKICTENFVKYMQNYAQIKEIVLEEVAKKVNADIWEINKDRKIDYVVEDYYCCEAVGGIIVENTLYCFSMGDCHITVLNENLDIIFTTINNHLNWDNYEREILKKQDPEKYDWNKPEYRALVRSKYRNKPGQVYNGKEISYAAFTGEKEAEYYIDTYKVDLKDAKYVCAYSDGCEPNFSSKENIKKLLDNPEEIKQVGHEKTLVIYEKV